VRGRADALIASGERLRRRGRLKEALRRFDAALKLGPSTWGSERRGETRLSLGRLSAALADLEEACAGPRPAPLALLLRGQARRALGLWRGAAEDFEAAYRRGQGLPEAAEWNPWEWKRGVNPRVDAAQAAMARRSSGGGSVAQAWRALWTAEALANRGESAAALAALLHAPAAARRRAAWQAMEGRLRLELGQAAASRRALEAAVRGSASPGPLLLARLGEAALRDGDSAASARAFDAAVAAARPDDAAAVLAWRGLARLWSGEFDAARRDFDAALRRDAGHAWAWGWRGAARFLCGDVDGGRRDAARALRLDPSDREARLWLAEMDLAAGRAASAAKGFAAAARGSRDASRDWALAGQARAAARRGDGASLAAALRELGDSPVAALAAALASRWRLSADELTSAPQWAELLDGVFAAAAGQRQGAPLPACVGRLPPPFRELGRRRAAAAERLRLAGRRDEAAALFEAAAAVAPEAWLLERLGETELERARPSQALAALDAALAAEPGRDAARALRGRALRALRRWAEAAAEYEGLWRRLPAPEAYELGRWKGSASRSFDRALGDAASTAALRGLDAALARRPGAFWPRLWRGELRMWLERGAEAADDLRRAARARPRHPWAWMALGEAEWEADRLAPAAAALGRARRLRPRLSARHHAIFGECLFRLGREAESAREFDASVREASAQEKAIFLTWRGLARLWAGRWAEAESDFADALRLEPSYAWAAGWLGGGKVARGRPADALPWLRRNLAADPGDNEAGVWMGEALRRLGRRREAERWLSRPSREDTRLWALVNLALARAAAGDGAGARRHEAAARLYPGMADFLDRAAACSGGGDGLSALTRRLEAALAASLGNRSHPPAPLHFRRLV
jgi:predicted Zn-dependent protease